MNLLQIHEPGQTPLPHADEVAVGIDLGTTHSVVAVAIGGKATVLRDICGGVLVPSVVHYKNGKATVGKDAVARLAEGRADVVTSIKRRMHEAATRLPFSDAARTPVEISADILKHLKTLAEQALGKPVSKAVITVPAYFDDSARAATRDAARLAGLEVLRLINEPTAAALAYGLDSGAEGIYAVYDLGGGTFDISILKMEKGVFRVLATGGDTQLGGDDFDAAVAQAVFGNTDPLSLHKARSVKERLSAEEKVEGITRQTFEALIEKYVERSIAIAKAALDDAGLAPAEVKGVVLAGGSTRIPLVRQRVKAAFGKEPLTDVNPDEVVAIGAALQAEGLTRGSDNLLLDVVPLSLGLETMGGLVEKVIYRNTAIPVAAVQEFTTYQDGQQGMIIHVVQGEREMTDQCRSLAKFELSGIPPMVAGIARVKVTFTIDADGLLSVSAQEATTGTVQSVAVKPSYGLAPEEMEQMLLASMKHAKEDILMRLLAEARMEAERSILELESAAARDAALLEKGEKEAFKVQVAAMRAAMKETDRDRIDYETQQLGAISRAFAERRMNKAIEKALQGKNVSEYAGS